MIRQPKHRSLWSRLINGPAIYSVLIVPALFLTACSSQNVTAGNAAAGKKIAISTVQAAVRTVPASFEETGSFVADESSHIAAARRHGCVVATPVNVLVGDFVKEGQVVCELDHRDAQLRLEQARAQLDQAQSALRQAQSRLGLNGGAGLRCQPGSRGSGRPRAPTTKIRASLCPLGRRRCQSAMKTW